MKKFGLLYSPLLLGVVGFALRLFQQGAFDPATGLADRGDLRSVLMAVYLSVVGVGLLTTQLQRESRVKLSIDDAFAAPTQKMLPILAVAMLLLGVGGAYLAYGGYLDGNYLRLVLGAFGVVACLSLLYGVALWRRGKNWGALLLAPTLMGVVWLLATYKQYADYPVVEALYVQILAAAAITCAFYQLAAFGFGQGSRRVVSFILPAAVVLGLTVLADDLPLGIVALDVGCTAVLGGFWACRKQEK